MTELKSNAIAFLKKMQDGPEFKRQGFEVLLARKDPEQFFAPLLERGLLRASDDPWALFGYMKALATKISASNEARVRSLGRQVVQVVREIAADPITSKEAGRALHVLNNCVEVMAALPDDATGVEDAAVAASWLPTSGYSGITVDLCKWTIDLVGKSDDVSKAKALALLAGLLKLRDSSETKETVRLQLLADSYWVEQMLEKHARNIGAKLASRGLQLFHDQLRALVATRGNSLSSVFIQSAIEEHPQNQIRSGAGPILISGMRDALVGWFDTGDSDAEDYVRGLLCNKDFELGRRIGLHVVDERFQQLHHLLADHFDATFISPEYRHELHRLLSRHFASLVKVVQDRVLDAIADITYPDVEKGQLYARYDKARWLSACEKQGVLRADQMMSEVLLGDPTIAVPEHPDFDTYHESAWGSGPSPYSVEELLSSNPVQLIERLETFQETNQWKSPSRRGLSDALEEAVRKNPLQFIAYGSQLAPLPWTFRYSILNSFVEMSRSAQATPTADPELWDKAWPFLLDLIDIWLADPTLLDEPEANPFHLLTATQRWIPSAIARLLEEGLKKDDWGISPTLHGRVRAILELLLRILPPETRGDWNSPLSQAINSERGRVLEAFLHYAWRCARLETKASGNHSNTWASVKPRLDVELDKAAGGNFEFSAIVGCWLPKLYFHLSAEWVTTNIRRLIPLPAHPQNARCFLDGMAYAHPFKPIYQLLLDHGLVDDILRTELTENGRERFINTLALAYLWGQEKLDGPHVQALLSPDREQDLVTFLRFFRQIAPGELSKEQKGMIQMLSAAFRALHVGGKELKSATPALIDLVRFFDGLDDEHTKFLVQQVPQSWQKYDEHQLVIDLNRLVDNSPKQVAAVALAVTGARDHFFDYEGRMRALVIKLHEKKLFPEALRIIESVLHDAAFQKLGDEIKNGTVKHAVDSDESN